MDEDLRVLRGHRIPCFPHPVFSNLFLAADFFLQNKTYTEPPWRHQRVTAAVVYVGRHLGTKPDGPHKQHIPPATPTTMKAPEHSFKALGSNPCLFVCLFFKTIKMAFTQWGSWGIPGGLAEWVRMGVSHEVAVI